MRIAFDYRIFSLQVHGGVSRYIAELATHLAHRADTHTQILAFAHINDYLASCPPGLVVGRRVPKIPYVAEARHALDEVLSRAWLTAGPPDILHETYFEPHDLAPRRCKTVVTVHDMIHEKFRESIPAGDPTSRWKAEAVRRADRVICVSDSTRRDLLDALPVDPAKVFVVHHGVSITNPGGEDLSPCPEPYLLFLGGRGGAYKNFGRLLAAYAHSEFLSREFVLVCFGGGPLSAEETAQFHALGLPEGRVRTALGDDASLARYYRHAAVFAYPSLYEGFGLPVLEAMAQGCPVACGTNSSLPEVAGDAAATFDSTNPDSIAETLERILQSSESRSELAQRGRARAALFSWERCANETYSVYYSLVSSAFGG